MSTPPPITIPDLDSAVAIDPVNDYVIVRQGLTDRKATIAQISTPSVELLNPLPTGLVATDLFLVSRQNPDLSYSAYKGSVAQISFLPGTAMWFWQASPPLNWEIIAGVEDVLLAIKSNGIGSTYENAGSVAGNWQQEDHILTINEIPAHTHGTRVVQGQGTSGTAREGNTPSDLRFAITTPTGGGAGHNHGHTWRPNAAVGLLCRKNNI